MAKVRFYVISACRNSSFGVQGEGYYMGECMNLNNKYMLYYYAIVTQIYLRIVVQNQSFEKKKCKIILLKRSRLQV